MVPFAIDGELITTNLRGMGNKNLSTYGFVYCKIVFKNCVYLHKFFVLPDDEAVVPLLIGRDLLHKMNIKLCQLIDYRYSIDDIKKLNDNKAINMPKEAVVSALKS